MKKILNDRDMKSQQKPQREASAVDLLVQSIKRYIQEQNLVAGNSLPTERELGEKFNVARNTVREAIRILKAYGVIEVRPKVGAIIVNRHMDAALNLFSFQLNISKETFQDIQGFRRLIEVGSVDKIFANLKPKDIENLSLINDKILKAKSVNEAAQIDFEFHATLLEIANNETVLNVYNTMKSVIVRLMETGKNVDGLEATFEVHLRVINALRTRDRLAFQFYMSGHLDQGLTYIESSTNS
jgi:DNA-binding FadR family transcriptional regulator